MEERKYTKLSELVGSEFTIQAVKRYVFKKWDAQSSKMISEDNYFEGARKIFELDTDKGKLDLSESQIGTIFAKVQHAGQADIIGTVVGVKSNGKTGIDIRYYLNPQKKVEVSRESEDVGFPDLPPEWN